MTGGNKGIGLAIAHQLGQKGYTVWLGCRNEQRGTQAADDLQNQGIEAYQVVMDVTKQESVYKAAKQLEEKVGYLDALINNAGMHFGPPPPATQESLDQIRSMFEVNTFGPLLVTQAFVPLLRKSEAGRIVMISSGLGSLAATMDMTRENWDVGFAGYCASKTTLHMITFKLAKELVSEGIKVNAADPGLTSTDLTAHMGQRTPEEAAKVAVTLATLDAFGPTGGFFRSGTGSEELVPHRW